MSKHPPNVGLAIKVLRLERRMKQKDLCISADISPSFLCQIENGHRNFSIDTFINICTALNYPPSVVFLKAESYE